MTFSFDPQLQRLMDAEPGTGDAGLDSAQPDALALRALTKQFNMAAEAGFDPCESVTRTDFQVPVEGAEVRARWYTCQEAVPGSAVVYFHGGARIAGSIEEFDRYTARHTLGSGVPVLSVEYRLAPEHTGDTAARDGLDALRWLISRAPELEVDPGRIALMGDSAGAGLAASVAIAARNERIPVARQILMYPMLDDRTREPDPQLGSLNPGTYASNAVAWDAVRGGRRPEEIDGLTAAAREADYRGLAPAFIDVGELDIFRAEVLIYAQALLAAGVSTELHVRPGCAHGFDRLPIDVATRSWADRFRVLRQL